MDAAKPHKTTQPPAIAGAGELVLQNGRQAGTRRPLGAPATFIGRNQGCDIRLNVDGVDPLHCVLIPSPDGVHLRDLNSGTGTHVNGEPVESVLLRAGDLLRVGPFEFRVELPALTPQLDDLPIEDYRDSVRIQAAAVAAQQIALEEDELRLLKHRADLQEQEEQLATHLAEKQRQVQLWSEYTQAERETLQKEKLDHDRHFAKLEAECLHAKAELSNQQEKLTQEHQRINRIYQRLRLRWRTQWAAERAKYEKHGRRLKSDVAAFKETQELARVEASAWWREVVQFNTERELGTRQLQEGRSALKKDQDGWRRRRSLEMLALKTKTREMVDAQLKLKQAHQILVAEKDAWDQQVDSLRKELHGLNNRIVHQRRRVEQQQEEIARLDMVLRARGSQSPGTELALVECEVEIVPETPTTATAHAIMDNGAWTRRFDGLDELARELADQRVHLLEQYTRLAEIQDAWKNQRDHACTELDAIARRLLADERALADRHHRTSAAEATLEQRRDEIEAIRQEIQIARVQLRASAELFDSERQKQLHALSQKELLLQEQLAGLTQLRQRWNRRRLEETNDLRTKQAVLQQQHQETQEQRLKLFEKNQEIEEGKRILAEKSLALEQYRQEIFFRAKDPTAQRRVERLRRRWLTLNAALIRTAKNEGKKAKQELARLDAEREALLQMQNEKTDNDIALTARQAMVDEREAALKARQLLFDEELAKLESQRRQAEDKHLRLQDEVEALAKAVYEEPEEPAIDQAA
ncbi:MAG: FHA domain-containing protein [Gemmataceae bacterium]|nr:FHA domain-containing protein [Gemmataceae bacterium]